MFLACDVPWKDHGFASRVLDPARGLIGVLLLAQIGNHDIGALAGEGDGDCPADTRIRARDQRHFPSEAPCPGVTLLAVVRNRLHLIRQTRRRLLLLRLGRKGPVVSVRHGHLQPMNLESELQWGLDVPTHQADGRLAMAIPASYRRWRVAARKPTTATAVRRPISIREAGSWEQLRRSVAITSPILTASPNDRHGRPAF